LKNAIEMVFAISPLLALTTSDWSWRSIQGTYLLKVSNVCALFLTPVNNFKAFQRSW